MNTEKWKKYLFPPIIVLIVLGGLLLRFLEVPYRALEYDELWTMGHYSAVPFLSIFTDLATPNNHPLNSLLIRIFTKCFGYQFTVIRLPAFLFGAGSVFLAMRIVWKTLRRKDALLFTTVCMCFHGFLLFYSASARGYSAQTFFVLLTVYALFRLYRNGCSPVSALIFLLSAVLCCLCITSGLIFVCASCGTFILLRIRKRKLTELIRENRYFIIAGICFCVFAGLWYGMNFEKIRQGQSFGTWLDTPEKILDFLSVLLFHLLLLPFVAVHIVAVFFRKNPLRRVSAAFLIFFGLVFLSAFLTKAGPARVYMPLLPPAIITSAAAIYGIFRALEKEKILPAVYLLTAFIPVLNAPALTRELRPPDWIDIPMELIRDVPPEIYVNYSSIDSYPVNSNFPKASDDMLRRLSVPELKGFLQVNAKGCIELYYPPEKRPVTVTVPGKTPNQFRSSDGVLMEAYELKKLSASDTVKGKILFFASGPLPQKEFQSFFRILNSSGELWYLTNLFLNKPVRGADGVDRKASAYVCPNALFDADHYLEISRQTGGFFRFYLLQ